MALTTSLAGRVRNTSLPKSHALLPLLEAVVNSIQAIDSRFGDDVGRGRLIVRIQRDPQEALDLGTTAAGRAPQKPIVGFTVEDNGIGFTQDNMDSFETLDSDHKAALGCRGVGRLLWLKAFDKVAVRSAHLDETGKLSSRQFRFSIEREVEQEAQPTDFADTGTVVSLEGFKKDFQRSAAKTVDAIAREVFEHCAWYFLRPGGAPDLIVADEDDSVSLRELMDAFVYAELPPSRVEVKGRKFDLVNLCLKSSARNSTPRLHWCAASRVVLDESLIGKVPGLYGRLKDEASTDFNYVCYLSSDFLDENVRADRTAFDIPERVPGGSLLNDLTLEDIRTAVLAEIEKVLAVPLSAAREEGQARVNDFVSNKAPRYRPVSPGWSRSA